MSAIMNVSEIHVEIETFLRIIDQQNAIIYNVIPILGISVVPINMRSLALKIPPS